VQEFQFSVTRTPGAAPGYVGLFSQQTTYNALNTR